MDLIAVRSPFRIIDIIAATYVGPFVIHFIVVKTIVGWHYHFCAFYCRSIKLGIQYMRITTLYADYNLDSRVALVAIFVHFNVEA